MTKLDVSRTALLLVDMQNDVCHSEGAFARAGYRLPDIGTIAARLATLGRQLRAADGWIVATLFTLVPGKHGEPFKTEHYRMLRPFLGKGDFVPGSWGHDLVEELKPADLTVEKIAASGFYVTRLEWVLRQAQIETLIIGGVTTNVSVATTVRDAHLRDFRCIVLEDGCAAFSPEAHKAAIADLASLAAVKTCKEAMAMPQAA